jgi:hypothetical protein
LARVLVKPPHQVVVTTTSQFLSTQSGGKEARICRFNPSPFMFMWLVFMVSSEKSCCCNARFVR